MKKFFRPAIMILISLVFAMLCAAATTSMIARPARQDHRTSAAFFLQTITATPQPADNSEIGSTDRIVVMGFVIVMIIVIPILLRRKSWSQS